MTTLIVRDPRHALHDADDHPERAARLHAVNSALEASGLLQVVRDEPARLAIEPELLAVHTRSHIDSIQRLAAYGGDMIGLDTYVTPGSWEAALASAGAAMKAVEAVVQGRARNAFVLMRPPGHHCTASEAMGFCLLNNVALAARTAQRQGMRRVAIIDFDVHHGNGTQEIFYDDASVLFCSSHGFPLYPGTGTIGEIGAGPGAGQTLNAPLPHGTGDVGILQLYEQVIVPAIRRFHPDVMLISAGFDGHFGDPLGPLAITVSGYVRLATMLYNLATELCGGRLVFCLEGGYNLRVLGACVVATIGVLLGRDAGPDPFAPPGVREPDITPIVNRLRREHPLLSSWW